MASVRLFEVCAKERTRGLDVETIPWHIFDKDALAFANTDRVPVLVDSDKAVSRSFEIAKHLEETYPEGPTLFGGEGGEAGCLFADHFANSLIRKFLAGLLLDCLDKLEGEDAEFFRASREKLFGMTLEQACTNVEEKVKDVRQALTPIRSILAEQLYLGGDKPLYSDFALTSVFLMPKALSKLQLLEENDVVVAYLKRVLALFEDKIPEDTIWEQTELY